MVLVAGVMTGIALTLAAAVVLVSGITWPLAVAVFLFWGPVTACICELIARSNPLLKSGEVSADNADERKVVWMPATGAMVILSLVAGLVGKYGFGASFRPTFGYAALIIAGAMSVNAIVMEVEDNGPGGWLRPDTWDDEKK